MKVRKFYPLSLGRGPKILLSSGLEVWGKYSLGPVSKATVLDSGLRSVFIGKELKDNRESIERT
jgi:hypothetical protein